MSVPDDTRDQLEEQNLRPQDMDANTAGRYAGLEQVLKEIKKPAQRQEKLPNS